MKTNCVVLFAALALAACGGESKVGNQQDAAPQAVASVFGSNVNTEESVTVRSGSDILLSGQNSEGIDDPILEFEWKQINIDDYEVALFERNSNSVVFTAPSVPVTESEGVILDFELSVKDADGVEVSDTVQVRVVPAADADHFLSRPRVDENYVLIVAPDTGVELIESVPITIEISQRASWTDRQGAERELSLGSSTLHGTVRAGSTPTFTDPANLYFIERIPLIDADEINKSFQKELRSGRLEFENVEQARLHLSLELTQQAPGDIRLLLARNGELGFELIDNDSVSTGLNRYSFTTEWLQQQTGMESRVSATNYYRCIDPNDQAATLDAWLAQAGFYEGADDVIHATYVNNYDLNFGRDMFLRTDGNGNVYSYVTNYPTLENTLAGRNDFAVVVMEYSPAPTGNCGDGTFTDNDGGKKIVKFYAYVPDETTGQYVRAPTMNFDGRGERALPGVCIACHFGDPNSNDFNVDDFTTVDASAADLNSSFMIWDLDAYLYTNDASTGNNDPIYSANEISPEVTAAFSREAQEASFRQLNQAVLQTFTYDINQLKRFETPIKLLHGFYGNADQVDDLNFGTEDQPLNEQELVALKTLIAELPENSFNGEYVQPGWEGEEELYHRVFARNCRLCHAQIGEVALDFNTYNEFVSNERLVPYVYEQGLMPLSRLTMDRFWTDFYGELSGAEFLRAHLNSDNNPDNDVAPGLTPGAPVAVLSPEENAETEADVIIDFDGSVLFDATASLFSDQYQWRLDGAFQSSDSKYLFDAGVPGDIHEISVLAISSSNFVTSETETRSILVRNNSPMVEAVPAQTITEGDSLLINLYSALCPQGVPDSLACRSVFGDIQAGDSPVINIIGDPVNARIDRVDSTLGEVELSSTASEAEGNASFNFTISDSFGEQSNLAEVVISVNSLDGPVIGSPDLCSVDALSFDNESSFPVLFDNSECSDPSLNDTIADGLSLSIVAVDGSELRPGASVEIASGDIQFTPGRFFVGQESFTYTVQDSSLSAKTSTGTVLVSVEATQTYTSLTEAGGVFATSGDEGCVDCHDGNLAGAPNWFNVENVRLAATNTNVQPYGPAEITLAEPTSTEQLLSSILFKNACNSGGTHTGGNRLCLTAGAPDSVDDLNDFGRQILIWLEEGAQNN